MLDDVREKVADALAEASTDSAVMRLDGGDLAIVFLESAEIYLVTVKQARFVLAGLEHDHTPVEGCPACEVECV
jgi:hypothetical protein